MKCNDFPGVVYSRLIAFGKKRENKTHGKISHSTVSAKFMKLTMLKTNSSHWEARRIVKILDH